MVNAEDVMEIVVPQTDPVVVFTTGVEELIWEESVVSGDPLSL